MFPLFIHCCSKSHYFHFLSNFSFYTSYNNSYIDNLQYYVFEFSCFDLKFFVYFYNFNGSGLNDIRFSYDLQKDIYVPHPECSFFYEIDGKMQKPEFYNIFPYHIVSCYALPSVLSDIFKNEITSYFVENFKKQYFDIFKIGSDNLFDFNFYYCLGKDYFLKKFSTFNDFFSFFKFTFDEYVNKFSSSFDNFLKAYDNPNLYNPDMSGYFYDIDLVRYDFSLTFNRRCCSDAVI